MPANGCRVFRPPGTNSTRREARNRWAGIMGFTESGLPLVGPVGGMKGVYSCAGFNGHGMGFAFMSAKRLSDSL
jgi:glycine/D-amino acid oxidase-like deaminating enzyme